MAGDKGFRVGARAGAVGITLIALVALGAAVVAQHPKDPELFRTANGCMACHNGLSAPDGEDISIGFSWRASMMANSARDPYWHAAVRRELMDFPEAQASIENECSRCHMPMANETARAAGRLGEVFANLPIGESDATHAALAADGVSCTVCHQIQPDNLGARESFTGNFIVDRRHPWDDRQIFGAFEVDSGRVGVMRSASAFKPTEGTHIQQSEVCATCHTLYTHALGAGGEGVQLPEQMPYQEWLNSDFRDVQSCQSCHMPEVEWSTPITSVLGQPREAVSRHTFLGGNFFMIRMLNRYRAELGVAALPQEMEAAAARTEEHLQSSTARISITSATRQGGTLSAAVSIENLAGHKFPTAYPSRRAWLEFMVTDVTGRPIFRSGELRPDGSIIGNDNDAAPASFEPHYGGITSPEQVQIYESIMAGPGGAVTTGLLTAVDYLKDNRILPRGFDKANAQPDVAIHGPALEDPDFTGGSDRVSYRVPVGAGIAPFRIRAILHYQPIGFRWANNLREYRAPETDRFVRYYDSMSEGSSIIIAEAEATVN